MHIEVDCHYNKEAYDDKTNILPHVTTYLQIVDIFTKALPYVKHQFFMSKLMLVHSPTYQFEGGVNMEQPHSASPPLQ